VGALHQAVSQTINEIKAARKEGRAPEGEEEEANLLAILKSFDVRLHDLFYKHQNY
jgi:hypothetical protein